MRRKQVARLSKLLAVTFLLTTFVAGAQAGDQTTPSRRNSPSLLFIPTDQQRRDSDEGARQ
jgi:hypothetical protein